MIWLLLVLFAAFVSGDDCETCTSLLGGGPSAPGPMIKQLSFAYSLLKPTINVEYNLTQGAEAFYSLKQPCRKDHLLDFVVSDVNYPLVTGYEILGGDPNLSVIPFLAGAMVLPYYLPSLSWEKGETLILSREVIWKIYSWQIIYWDDEAIKLLNDGFKEKLPHERIVLVFQNGTNGNNVMIQTILSNVANVMVKNISEYWFPLANVTINQTRFANGTQTNAGNITKLTKWGVNDFSAVSHVLTTPYTLGYAPLALVDQAGISYASIQNRKGNVIQANAKSLAAAIRGANRTVEGNLTKISNRYVTDVNDPDAYPFTALMYLGYWKNVNVNCAARRELWKFLNWVYHDPAAEEQITASVGYAPFFPEFKAAMLERVKAVQCHGEILLQLEYVESSSTPIRQAVLSIAAILATLTVVLIATLSWKRNNRITRAAGLAFALSFLLGCLLNYISMFLWVEIPTTDQICQSRYLLVALGYTLLLGSMFAKCWEISKAFNNAQTGDSLGALQELSWWQFCRVFFLVVGINFLILIVLASVDAPKSLVITTDALELHAIHICYVLHTKEWVVVEFLYFSCLTIWGGYLAYKTRNIWEKYNYPNESKSILISIYNLIFCVVILVPLASSLTTNIEVVFFLSVAAIGFPTTFALMSVYGPKITAFLGSSFKKSKMSGGLSSDKSNKQAQSPTLKAVKERDDGRKAAKGAEPLEEKLIIVEENGEREHSEDRGLRNEVPQRSPSTPEPRSLRHVVRSSSGTPLQNTALAGQADTPASPGDDEDTTTKRRLQFIAEVQEAAEPGDVIPSVTGSAAISNDTPRTTMTTVTASEDAGATTTTQSG